MQRSFGALRAPAVPAVVIALLATLLAGSAFAASSFTLQGALAGFTLREWLLSASLLLLVIALIARLVRSRVARRIAPTEAPDLRWWRNTTVATP